MQPAISPMPACTVMRSFEIRCDAAERLPILPTKNCVARKTRWVALCDGQAWELRA